MAAIGKPPKALLNRTEVLPHLQSAFSAFFDLSPGRQVGFGGESYISAAEIHAYCLLIGLEDAEDRLDFFRMIRAMDGAYLKHRDDMRELEKDGEEKGNRNAGRRR